MKRILLAATVVLIGLLVYLTVEGLTSRSKPADVMIVFGSKVGQTGVPSARLRARLEAALQLYKSKIAPAIIVSGGMGKEGFDESVVMKSYLVGKGVPAVEIYTDGQGINTDQTCRNASRIMIAKGWKQADVVSQFFHISRVKMSCQFAGINVVGATAPRYFEIRDIYSLARETVALPVYWIKSKFNL